MHADCNAMGFHYRENELVYLAGSREPYTVVGLMYITLASSGEERRYCLKSSLGDERWIDERHVLAAPARQAAYE